MPLSLPAQMTWQAALGGACFVFLLGLSAGFLVGARERQKAYTLEECADMARLHMRKKEPGRALAWIQRARKLHPASAELALQEADLLLALGDVDAAFQLIDNVHETTREGAAALRAARALQHVGYDRKHVLDWLATALARSPELAAQIHDADFPGIETEVRHLKENSHPPLR